MIPPSNADLPASFLELFFTPSYLGGIISFLLKKKLAIASDYYKPSPTYPGDQTAKHSFISILL